MPARSTSSAGSPRTALDFTRPILDLAAFRLKRLEAAQRRHLIVIQTLTTLRKMMPAGLAPSGSIKLFKDPDSKQA